MTTDVLTKLQKNVREIIEQLGLSGTLITTAVSGGPDSLCMLHILHSISADTGIDLWGAHLDHGIRGSESEKDAEFVKSTFEKIGIPYTIQRLNIPKLSEKEGASIELTARIHRHIFLADVTESNNSSATALGHNAGDQAETILMHLIRGTGLRGLTGMQLSSERSISGIRMKLLRPLLFTSRREIEHYCKEANLTPKTDTTNLSMQHSRNGVRANLIPALQNHNPKIESSLLRLSKSATRDIEFLEDYTDSAYTESTNTNNGVVSINKSLLKSFPEAIKHRVLGRAASFVFGDNIELTMTHIDAIANLANGQSGNSIDLPGGTTATNSYSDLVLYQSMDDTALLPKLPDITKIKIPGNTNIPGWNIETFIQSIPESAILSQSDKNTAWLPHHILVGGIEIRARTPGDRFQPKGMTEEKKLQDFMVDEKIPRHQRDRVPIVEINYQGKPKIVWVVGWRLAEWATVKPGDRGVLIKFSRTKIVE